MPEATLLGDVIQPAWDALTPEQRTCWHFWAAKRPRITYDGTLRTLYGQQAHYAVNAPVAVVNETSLISDPPIDETPPPELELTAQVWPLAARIEGTTTRRRGIAYIEARAPLPTNIAITIYQTYQRPRRQRVKGPRTRHVRVEPPGTAGQIPLDTPNGYYATTAGENRYSRIIGRTAKRRTDLPIARVKIINLENGKVIRNTIANPFTTTHTRINRPRSTSVNPTTGDHYP